MAKQAWETVVAYKLVWLRVLGFFLVPAWIMWDTVVNGMTGAQWDALSGFEKFNLIGKCFASGFIAFLAFLDQSMNKAGTDLDKKRKVDDASEKRELLSNTGP